MPYVPESGRQIAHVLIDAVMAYDADGDDTQNARAVSLALETLGDLGAVTVTTHPDADTVRVDASDLLGATIVSMLWLVDQLAEATGSSEEEVAAALREFMDD
ncbi:hypothetical protein [Leifsonia poae]|uniref:Uncharacterized protein n=1 Tax=Leifsonia poae TaxID=110933 RepID=A0A9W6M038_9MICO|nr:hypothetical protein [Leifsonia poae]GLJ76515.1 hypothetical protein GCM10017584_20890 [Leifsonia poae]